MEICDWGHEVAEVRKLPTGSGGNLIVCHYHFDVEMRFRKRRNLEADDENLFKIEKWGRLEIYKGE